jgi:CPA2 family monovalent cation:H+ antiporter-2
VIGTDSALEAFAAEFKGADAVDGDPEASAMQLRRVMIGEDSPFLGRNIKDSGLRNQYRCLVAGIEKPDGTLHAPDINYPIALGDSLWLVGEDRHLEVVENLRASR